MKRLAPILLATGVLAACSGAPSHNPGGAPDAGSPSADAGTTVLSAVAITCEASELIAGASVPCAATASDQLGQAIAAVTFAWTSSDPMVATVDGTGRVTGVAAGEVTVTASATVNGVTRSEDAALTVKARQPTIHEGVISVDETWRAADNPHHVKGSVAISAEGSPTLTIEAGVQLFFEPYAGLLATGGSIRALGSAEAPIVMDAASEAPLDLWTGLTFDTAGSSSELNHVTVSRCGQQGACIAILNGDAPVLRSVTIRDSKQTGIAVAGARFGQGSSGLRIIDSDGMAARVSADSAESIPADTEFSGNAENEVRLDANVQRTQTWPALSVPYSVFGIVAVSHESSPVLTLLPGTEIRFGPYASLLVGYELGGALVAQGTAEAPIRFVANGASPTPGFWQGLHFYNAEQSRLDHVVVSHSGETSVGGKGNVNVHRELGAFITNTTLSNSAGCGVGVSDGSQPGTTPVTTDLTMSTLNNTFVNNVGPDQCVN